MLVAASLFSVMAALGKVSAETYPLIEVIFFRNLFGMVAPVAELGVTRQWRRLKTRHIGGHLWRAGVGMTAMGLSFWSFHLLPMADATALSFTAPLFMTALAWPVLNEKVGIHRGLAVVVGFFGVLVLAQPDGDVFSFGLLVALGAGLGTAVAQVALRQLGRTELPMVTVFYFGLFSTLFFSAVVPFVWVWPTWDGFLYMAGVGLVGGLAQQFMTRAFALAPASVVGPFNYAGIVWASLFGWLIWDQLPTLHVVAGAAIVIGSGLYILYREVKRTGRARAVMPGAGGTPPTPPAD